MEGERKLARLAELSEPLAEDDRAEEALQGLREADADTLREAPEELLRALFDAFKLTITYDGRTGRALCRVW